MFLAFFFMVPSENEDSPGPGTFAKSAKWEIDLRQ